MSKNIRKFLIFLLIIAYSCTSISCNQVKNNENNTIEPDEIFLVASVENDISQRVDTIYIKEGENFTIYPVVKSNNVYYSDIDKITVDGTTYNTLSINKIDYSVELYQIYPVMKGYDNFENVPNEELKDYIMPIEYKLKSLNINTISNEKLKKGYGTYYFGINLELFLNSNNGEFSTDLFIHKEYEEKIIQVVYRENDTYLGILKELMNTPFVYVPKYLKGLHQTDERIGSDCAEFAIYGMRRLGYEIPYCGPNNIYKYANEVVSSQIYLDKNDLCKLYREESMDLVKVNEEGIQPGDIIHFGEQVSIFYDDKGIVGVLDGEDLLIQSYYNEPEIVSIENSGFYGYPIKVYRFIAK